MCRGFMYSADADGRGIFLLLIFLFYLFFLFAFFCWHTLIYGANWNETQSPTAWVTPPPPTHHDLMKIYWVYHPDSTTTLAQRVGMVALGTNTLAQRRHGRRRHNYGGTTSFSQHWANIFLPTICQRCRPWNTCSLIFWGGICFPGVKYKISHKNGFELKCTIYITYLWR